MNKQREKKKRTQRKQCGGWDRLKKPIINIFRSIGEDFYVHEKE